MANATGLLIAILSIAAIAIALNLYRVDESENLFYWLKSPADWSLFRGSFLVGGAGGAMVVYFMLQNFSVIDDIFRGLVN
ncbi:MAG: hypothetical protein GDA48_23545 [Hormoscilla sp. GM102CHS1]|nr:hypothetical protein [Hormoscilla sp. GM102CHS1]